MSISDRLDQIESRPVAWPFLDRADADKSALVAALRAVLDLHERADWGDGHMTCSACWDPTHDGLRKWPCPTVRAVTAALGEVQP